MKQELAGLKAAAGRSRRDVVLEVLRLLDLRAPDLEALSPVSAAYRILEALKDQCRGRVRLLYRAVCRSRAGLDNRTWMIRRLGYRISEELGLTTARMVQNHRTLRRGGPELVPDIYGARRRTEQLESAEVRRLLRRRRA